ncbi:MAG: phytanoyl-CoA dioxygenase [Rhodospirillaceae bacterium]|nr:MAG: phytanoyl-CoA dioxygenase [Rhodospirillaceae bacterium]
MMPILDRAALGLAEHGAAFYSKLLSPIEITGLQRLCDQIIGRKAGVRIYASDLITKLMAADGEIGGLVAQFLGPSARPVRAVMFDKSATANWALSWHQDRTIAVHKQIETEGFGNWSTKSGCLHVEPPFHITRQMITIRLHLDDVDPDNAPLLIAPRSHDMGRISADVIPHAVSKLGSFQCLAEAGDVWLYSTGILHASDKAAHPRRRRVLQVDFSALDLPNGLDWLGLDDIAIA